MTLEQLRVLQAIVQEGTFRGAGKRLHKSQPAISALIRNLEHELGLRLFDRKSYRPKLTAEGGALYDQALIVLRETGRLKALAQRLTGAEEREVRLAVNQIFPLKSLLERLRAIDMAYPATRITVTSDSVGGAMDRLLQAQTDIAVTTDAGMDPNRMELRPFAVAQVIPVARPDYGPAARGGYNRIEDMRGDVQVIVADSSVALRKQDLDVIPEARHWTVTDMAAKKDIILAGMGWGGLPEHWVAKELASGELVRVHVEGFDVRRAQLYLVRRTDRPVGIVAEVMWRALSENGSA